ncbi:OmpA family protein [Buttiauxella sp. B2]|uniref:OmpA family protein n=1 Tax=Buttiauxella sp. B2 TaxID=2587812 RepID=UPI001124862A|nr:OmpA family protein [Buttiauxella sp. B2]TNV23016.1 OmpA family protein [Buttiauxella sp. B2]
MRNSVIGSIILHVLVSAAALLWLLWYFIPVGPVLKGMVTVLVVALAAWLTWKSCRRQDSGAEKGAQSFAELPPPDTQGPIVLVCGDGLDALFQDQTLRKTAQGCWLRVGDVARLPEVVRQILAQQPRQTGQLSVMYICLPDQHRDEAVLRESLKVLRQQIRQTSTLTGFTLPVVLSCKLSGPVTPWVVVRGDKPVVSPADEAPVAFVDWQQTGENLLTLPLLSQAYAFIRATLLDELEKADRLNPPVHPFAVALRTGAASGEDASVWSHWLYRRTCLQLPPASERQEMNPRFPDAVLPLLSPFASPVQGGQRTRCVLLLLWLCALAALGFSALNNAALIRQVSADLQRWAAIPMTHYAPKAHSLADLKQDALLLERWQRQGEPLKLSLGYYPGQRLWLVLQQAVDTYVPEPPPKPVPVPKIVRLDSMSLFDSGKAALKDGSTKVLVNALVGIKAKPGWLIVVSGHTDNTGSALLNQTLSLQRAGSVRDWMRDTGDVPESCFAVQGYGDSRPIASNDTPDGRAHNRRVEISLVPQADACRLPDIKTASSELSGVSTQEMEK